MSLLTCNQFLDELSEFLDEDVNDDVRQELQTHLTQCPNCWVMVDTTKKTIQIYKGLEAEPLPNGLKSRLMGALQNRMQEGGKP